MSSFEDRLPGYVGLASTKQRRQMAPTGTEVVDFIARPENYQGSNIHNIRLQLIAQSKQAAAAASRPSVVSRSSSVQRKSRIASDTVGSGPSSAVGRFTQPSREAGDANLRLTSSAGAKTATVGPQPPLPTVKFDLPLQQTLNDTDSPNEALYQNRAPTDRTVPTVEEVSDIQSSTDPARNLALPFDADAPSGRIRSPSDFSARRGSFASRSSGQSAALGRREIKELNKIIAREHARERLRHVINVTVIVVKWISSLSDENESHDGELAELSHRKPKTFMDMADEARTLDDPHFDVSYYKSKKEVTITNEVKSILQLPPLSRTPEQIQLALYDLQSLESFAEYPLHMQTSLCQVGVYQDVSRGRVIIRQGHLAENFYFILSGEAMVKFLEHNKITGENQLRTASVLRRGSSFGELALLHHSRRTATVISQDSIQLLTIGRHDFFTIIMGQHQPGHLPEHIKFISGLDFMKDWPIHRLIQVPECCIFHYFKRNTVMVRDSNQSEWLYIVKTGSCRVIKQLKASVPRTRPEHQECEDTRRFTPTVRAFSAFSDTFVSKKAHYRYDNEAQRKKLSVKRERLQSTPAFVQVEILEPGDVFGLRSIHFEEDCETVPKTSVSLVSNGAECVMLSKKLYIDNAKASVRRMVRHQIRPYPSDDVLQDNYQRSIEWTAYRRRVVDDCVRRTRRWSRQSDAGRTWSTLAF